METAVGSPENDLRGGALWWWITAGAVIVAFVSLGGAYIARSRVEEMPPVRSVLAPASLRLSDGSLIVAAPPERTVKPYTGYGTWVDVFDYDPAYGSSTVSAGVFSEMSEAAVRTVYLQAARLDERTPDGLVDPWLLTELLLTAHADDLDMVAWYLPRFAENRDDLERLLRMHDFVVLGHRFDGLAVDIEWTGDGIDHESRSQRLVELGDDLRQVVGADMPIAAITQPPVLMEVINPDFWPGFPWTEMAEQYDVWMPMSYWSFRSDPYDDGYTYHEESVRRLRANIADPNAIVHGIGGIGGVDGVDDTTDTQEPLAAVEEIERFVDALVDTGSVGGSVYDWNTLEPSVRTRLAELFTEGPGSTLDR